MSSIAGRLGYPYRLAYSTSKWGLIGFTKTLSMELGADNIRVNAILPGAVDGDRVQRVLQARADVAQTSLEEVTQNALKISRSNILSIQSILQIYAYFSVRQWSLNFRANLTH